MTSLFSTLVYPRLYREGASNISTGVHHKNMFWSAKQESKTSNCGTGGLLVKVVSFKKESKKKKNLWKGD